MVTPTINIVLFLILVLVAAFAYKIGTWSRNDEIRQLKWTLRVEQDRVRTLENWCDEYRQIRAGCDAALATLTAERDRYRDIAVSHEIRWPDPPMPTRVTRQVWAARRYAGHPSANLEALVRPL